MDKEGTENGWIYWSIIWQLTTATTLCLKIPEFLQ